MSTILLALGSNLGDRRANLRAALAALEEAGVTVTRASFAWETPPVPADQPPFLNAAAAAETSLEPLALLAALKKIERALGRRPARRWGPRPIDLDILFYDGLRLDTPDLTIPHPRIAERAFVLAPLSEVWDAPLPVFGEPALALLGRVGLQGARRIGPI
ncbi:2-amino-4-hydroxy-6-hydroxymethyldihydropteridine diphosphokinase [Tepidiforma sp.]|jgi:2-amino-4-hydroxy-6-hydroxymethyldihydropteridine diphosphokinase|uniref:2-amino-4-hydroxy-6- hydroxymethyldihydropteridine diphosphokinase n=1 Tax=Tepidiforma sp. TaxID=2682230 RepID=UPI002606A095|nr:2-amino-4-hydroxy-6-hydroxymethyldihydropteridine diphosphokinase [Tepidiforma sp.]MCX7617747.1 2-amino-4-hydroxy-6-hydroxymethyldihydropteridine diphosphokinase [Tepidiforma sp.]